MTVSHPEYKYLFYLFILLSLSYADYFDCCAIIVKGMMMVNDCPEKDSTDPVITLEDSAYTFKNLRNAFTKMFVEFLPMFHSRSSAGLSDMAFRAIIQKSNVHMILLNVFYTKVPTALHELFFGSIKMLVHHSDDRRVINLPSLRGKFLLIILHILVISLQLLIPMFV
jgi:hypothetical protein